jgi:probable phosphoglycerate mutase
MTVSAAPASELWIVRHGATAWSMSGQHTSRTELPLEPIGEEQARALRPRLAETDFALVLTSPRQRARHTAELAGFPDAEVDEDLAEWDYGIYEGVTTHEIQRTVPNWSTWDGPTPEGETAEQIGERLDRVVARSRATAGHTLVFAHGHSLRALAARWVGRSAAEGRLFRLDTATVSVLGWERDRPVVTRWNV